MNQDMILTTTSEIEGYHIESYQGVIVGEAVLGANFMRDFFARVRDVVGGRSGAYEKELKRSREIAMDELRNEARLLGANAVVGMDLDYEVMGAEGSIIMVSVSGTAVKIRRKI